MGSRISFAAACGRDNVPQARGRWEPRHIVSAAGTVFLRFFLSRRGNGRFDMQRTLVRVAPVVGLPVMDDAAEND